MANEGAGQVAIIVPVYNQKKEYLVSCIDSVLDQKHQDWRLILVDDGSKKETADYLVERAGEDRRIKVVHQENKGPGAARNRGVREADGADYIAFLDSDDMLKPDMLSVCLKRLTDKNADIAICTYVSCDYEGPDETIFEGADIEDFRRLLLCSRGTRGIHFPFLPTVWGKLFKAELFTENPNVRFKENLSFGEDQCLLQEISPHAKRILIFNEELYIYRQNEESLVRSMRDDLLERQFMAFDELDGIIPASDTNLSRALDNYKAGYLAVYAKCYLYHPKSKSGYVKKRKMLKTAACEPHFSDSIKNIDAMYFTKPQYIYLSFIRMRFYDIALAAAKLGARFK